MAQQIINSKNSLVALVQMEWNLKVYIIIIIIMPKMNVKFIFTPWLVTKSHFHYHFLPF